MRVEDERLARLLSGWEDGDGPAWRRLAEALARLVTDGVLPDGAMLPTERALARRLGVSRSTTTAAYEHGKEQGLLDARQGRGTWVCRPPGAPPGPRGTSPVFAHMGLRSPTVLNLAHAEPRTDATTRALVERLDPGWLASHVAGTGYEPQGLLELRKALAGALPRAGLPAAHGGAESLLVTTGAQQAIGLALQVLCPPGSAVLVEDATYPGVLEACRRLGLRAVSVPTDSEGMVADELDRVIRWARPSLVFVVPVASNPVGAVMQRTRFEELATVLARHGVAVLDDRTTAPLAPEGTELPAFTTVLPEESVVTVGSLSKVAWAGVRCGWLSAGPRVLRELVAARIAADLSGELLGQALALALVEHLDHLRHAAAAGAEDARRALAGALAVELPAWRWPEPRGGAWLWVQLPGLLDARRFAEAAQRHGVLVVPGPAFSAEARHTDRIRLAAVESPEDLVEAARRLRAATDDLGAEAPAPTPVTLMV